MNFIKTEIEGLIIIEPLVYKDNRGFFYESYNKKLFNKNIGNIDFVQDNFSKSNRGVLRGFHFQKPPFDQSKLVRCISGKVLDIALDLRKESPTFGKYKAVILSKKNKLQMFIPKGFAHAFLVLSKTAVFTYKVDNIYAPDYDSGVLWSDPILNIDWGIPKSQIIISEKDQKLKTFNELDNPF